MLLYKSVIKPTYIMISVLVALNWYHTKFVHIRFVQSVRKRSVMDVAVFHCLLNGFKHWKKAAPFSQPNSLIPRSHWYLATVNEALVWTHPNGPFTQSVSDNANTNAWMGAVPIHYAPLVLPLMLTSVWIDSSTMQISHLKHDSNANALCERTFTDD